MSKNHFCPDAHFGRHPRLRRPLPETEYRLLNSDATPDDSEDDMPERNPDQPVRYLFMGRHSRLSAEAPEFVPGQSYASALSAGANEFVPGCETYHAAAQPAEPQYNVSMTPAEMIQYESQERLYEQFQRLVSIRPAHLSNSAAVSSSGAIELIKNTIHYLTTNPSQVDSYMTSVVAQLQQKTLDVTTVNEIIEILIEQGISEPNFRYTGAKMCQFLAKNLKLSKPVTFRHSFLKRFQQEFEKKDEWMKNPSQHNRVCGLTMFLGELFLNMEVEGKNGVTAKFAPLRMALKELILALLSKPTDVTVKAACQLLKLSGAAIQDTEHLNHDQGPQASYNDVFRKLEEISPTMGQTAQMLIASVLTLKETNWGRRDSSSSEATPDPLMWDDGLSFDVNEPVFYDAHGQPISREQAGFYVDEVEEEFADYGLDSGDVAYLPWANDDSAYDPYGYDLDCNVYSGEDGMDDEMEAAYEEFLKSQGQS